MNFSATFAGQSARGNCILEDVVADNGMRRQHVWLDAAYRGHFPAVMRGMQVSIQGHYRRYRTGAWTITAIERVEVVP